MSLERRLEALERQYAVLPAPAPIRIFTCDGRADDGGPSLADSPPVEVPPGSISRVRICSCVAEGYQECRYLDALQESTPGGGLLIRQYVGVDLAEV
jgi:hypothetical protein